MKAACFTQFKSAIKLVNLPEPTPEKDEVIIKVMATGLCRSDWHGWMGHDSDIILPHVPGHEFAGIIEEVGKDVKLWKIGDRVTVPFCVGCGFCPQCLSGNQQICDNYFQAGFTAWGSFAEFVKIKYADHNLVRLPDDMDFTTAAVLGCRFITSFRGLVAQGRAKGGEWLAVHGCGGVGLSAVMIGAALGLRVIAVDIAEDKLNLARSLGAAFGINALSTMNVPEDIAQLTDGGAHLSMDALGSVTTCRNSILSLRKRGRHIQLGLMAGRDENPSLPMGAVISKELEIIGSHGMQAHQYPQLWEMIKSGSIQPSRMIGRLLSLEEGIEELMVLDNFQSTGILVIHQF
jgi:alcohol dehydrogenase